MENLIARVVREEEGQDLIEYALLAGFISVALVAILTTISGQLVTLYTSVSNAIASAS
jgi:pilus assembly protein Flp/PilA